MYPVLTIIMRGDLPSLNCGKACAQASHASNAFINQTMFAKERGEDVSLAIEWINTTKQGFGTVKILIGSKEEIEAAVLAARANNMPTDFIIDPTYPYRVPNTEIARLIDITKHTEDIAWPKNPNDPVTLYREEMTCAYIFGENEAQKEISALRALSLHP